MGRHQAWRARRRARSWAGEVDGGQHTGACQGWGPGGQETLHFTGERRLASWLDSGARGTEGRAGADAAFPRDRAGKPPPPKGSQGSPLSLKGKAGPCDSWLRAKLRDMAMVERGRDAGALARDGRPHCIGHAPPRNTLCTQTIIAHASA